MLLGVRAGAVWLDLDGVPDAPLPHRSDGGGATGGCGAGPGGPGLGPSSETLAFSEKGSRSHFWAPVSQAETTGRRASGSARTRAGSPPPSTPTSTSPVRWRRCRGPDGVEPVRRRAIAPGVTVAGRFDGLGLRGNDSAPVRLDVEVADGARLGDDGGGFGLMMQVVLPGSASGNAAVSLGLAAAALDGAIAHASGLPVRAPRLVAGRPARRSAPTSRRPGPTWPPTRRCCGETAARSRRPTTGPCWPCWPPRRRATRRRCASPRRRCASTGGAGFSKQVGIDRPVP